MLKEHGAPFEYREYTKEPLSVEELNRLFAALGDTPSSVLRKRDAKKAGLTGEESDEELIALMAENPRLLQRPILLAGGKAVVGRPVENLASLL